ncbi:MAG: hypothetical protein ACRDG6_09955 [Candidatus Limnocylindria bacterium]
MTLTISLLAPATVIADSEPQTYLLVLEHPNVAMAPNGDTVAVTGEGEFSVNPKSAEGSGAFTHTFAAGGSMSGTWTATELLAYQSYGCGVVFGDPIPPELCGGMVKLRVTLTAGSISLPGILTVFCLIGPNPPNSAEEGITLLVPGIINFNKVVSGENVYVRLD